jgi:hypothetical protein
VGRAGSEGLHAGMDGWLLTGRRQLFIQQPPSPTLGQQCEFPAGEDFSPISRSGTKGFQNQDCGPDGVNAQDENRQALVQQPGPVADSDTDEQQESHSRYRWAKTRFHDIPSPAFYTITAGLSEERSQAARPATTTHRTDQIGPSVRPECL